MNNQKRDAEWVSLSEQLAAFLKIERQFARCKWLELPTFSIYLRRQNTFGDIPSLVIANLDSETPGKGYLRLFMRVLDSQREAMKGIKDSPMFVYVENVLNDRLWDHFDRHGWECVRLHGGLQIDYFMPIMDIGRHYK